MVNKALMIIGAVLLVGALLSLGYFVTTQQTAFKEQIWLPDFGRVECNQYSLDLQLGKISTSGGSFICGSNAYIPDTCSYHITVPTGGLISVSECEANSDICKTKTYTLLQQLGSGEERSYTIQSGKRIYINPTFRDVSVRETAQSYRLEIVDSGFKIVDPTGCSLGSAKTESHLESDSRNDNIQTVNYNGQIYMAKDTRFHYISSLKESISGNAVTIENINNGKPIYIYDIGRYYPIITPETGLFKGKLVADTWSPKQDDKIKCLPAGDFCDSNAQIIKPTEKKCEEAGGLTGEFKPKTANVYCTLTCNTATGNIDYTDKCVTLTSCPADKPFRDQTTLECIGGITPGVIPPSQTPILTYILIALAILVAVLLITQPKK